MSQAVIHVRIAREILGAPRPHLFEADAKLSVTLVDGLPCPCCKRLLSANDVDADTVGIELICHHCGESSLIVTRDEQ